jgi:hypothetical protein
MRTLTAWYDNEPDAKVAREWLFSHGVHANRVSLIARRAAAPERRDAGRNAHSGIWASVKELVGGSPEAGPAAAQPGGFVLTASVPEEKLEGALAILSRKGRVTVEEGAGEERRDGDASGSATGSAFAPVHERVRLDEHRWLRAGEGGDPAGARLEKAFAEKSVDFVETAEEATFRTEARIREYVVIRKTERSAVRTVTATAARMEADVERLR